MSHILPDVLQEGLILVFCGTAASVKSAEIGAYYANPSNAFWRTLHEVGLTPRQLNPTEFRSLIHYGIGLTDIAKHVSGNDNVLSMDDFDSVGLTEKMKTYQPQILAFTSKRGYREWRGIVSSKSVSYGWQDDMIGQTKIYVLPSPSGAARGYWDVSVWQALAEAVQQVRLKYGKHD
jgi:double-stranded uracil-DNA glycosylase